MNQINKKVGISVIGYGYWSPKIIRNIKKVEGFNLLSICEKDKGRHELIRSENPGVQIVQHYKDVFENPLVNAVVIATTMSSHFRIAKMALEHDKHVLVEKPMTLRAEEGVELMKLAKKRGLTLMIDHTYLYSNAIQALKKKIQAGELGDIYAVESSRQNLGLFQRDANVVWDLAPHDLSILLYLLRDKPSAVIAVGSKTVVHPKQTEPHASIAHIQFLFPNGSTSNVDVSWISPIKVRQIVIVGSKKMAMYDQLSPDGQVKIFDHGVLPNFGDDDSIPMFTYKTGEVETLALPPSEDLESMLRDYLRAVSTGDEPISNATIGVDVVRLLEAINKSIKSGGKKVLVNYGSGNFVKRMFSNIRGIIGGR